MKCKYCNERDAVKYSKYSSGEFCSRECACGFSTKAKRKEINEKVSKTLRDKPRKLKKIKICKYCNNIVETKQGKVCNLCLKWKGYISLYKKIKIYDKSKSFEKMNNNALKFLVDLYFNKMWSVNDILEKFNIRQNSLYFYFTKNGIKLRNLSNSVRIALLNGKGGGGGNNQYKSGWHTTWNGKQIYYRSSYELNYALELDKKKIPYEVEFKRILYYDTIKKEWRVAIPDFYLPLENKIVEMKSDWTYDEQNMNDKKKAYEEEGYNFELLFGD